MSIEVISLSLLQLFLVKFCCQKPTSTPALFFRLLYNDCWTPQDVWRTWYKKKRNNDPGFEVGKNELFTNFNPLNVFWNIIQRIKTLLIQFSVETVGHLSILVYFLLLRFSTGGNISIRSGWSLGNDYFSWEWSIIQSKNGFFINQATHRWYDLPWNLSSGIMLKNHLILSTKRGKVNATTTMPLWRTELPTK